MKFDVHIEFDGTNYIAYCINLIGCYAQSQTEYAVRQMIQEAVALYIDSYRQRYEPINPEMDIPQLDFQIKFKRISSEQLSNILIKLNYNLDLINDKFLLFRQTDFPFYRIVIPNVTNLSPIIVKKLFGEKNVILLSFKKREKMKFRQQGS